MPFFVFTLDAIVASTAQICSDEGTNQETLQADANQEEYDRAAALEKAGVRNAEQPRSTGGQVGPPPPLSPLLCLRLHWTSRVWQKRLSGVCRGFTGFGERGDV